MFRSLGDNGLIGALLTGALLLAGGSLHGVRAQEEEVVAGTSAPVAAPATDSSNQNQEPQTPTSTPPVQAVPPGPSTPIPASAVRPPRVPQTLPRPAAAPVSPVDVPSSPSWLPRRVMTVVHRLSGWKLLTWLTAKGASRVLGVDELPFAAKVHTNIVAGLVCDDGRTVVASLPRAEAESAFPPSRLASGQSVTTAAGGAAPGDFELTVVRPDGKEFNAHLVGRDESTGLSVLEVKESLFLGSINLLEAVSAGPVLTDGQRVRLFAPAQFSVRSGARAPAQVMTEGKDVVYMHMGELEGELSAIQRAPSGKVMQASVRAPRLTPEWTGAIAVNHAGAVVGIVGPPEGQPSQHETQMVTADAAYSAASRVLARRRNVPQPWLGARGQTVALTHLNQFISSGWSREAARALVSKRQGVMLTSVAPGTPAALAGLRPGDIIARSSDHEIVGVADFSFLLKEAGDGSTLNFTVLRAQENSPLKMAVTLSGAHNPIRATEEAEARAAEHEAQLALTEARASEAKVRTQEAEWRAALEKARLTEAEARRLTDAKGLAEAQQRLVETQEQVRQARRRVEESVARVETAWKLAAEAQKNLVAIGQSRFGGRAPTQLIDGLQAIGISPKLAARFHAQGGLLIVSVQPESQAAALGLEIGDVIETFAGKQINLSPEPFAFDCQTGSERTLGIVRHAQRLTIKLPEKSHDASGRMK